MTAKPFVKWVGGKSRLIPEIEKTIPDKFAGKGTVYVEPFVGGGAVLFWILQKYPDISHAVINDLNPDLITTYRVVKHNPLDLIARLEDLEHEYLLLDAVQRRAFFEMRRIEFNAKPNNETELAALMIFLNKTCFNGLYRVNSAGKFNVPHGRYANPKICDAATIAADSKLLQRVEIRCGDFATMAQYASDNTFFYIDPPYKPISGTSSFNSYTDSVFDDDKQLQLRDFCLQITKHKSGFVLSNSDLRNTDANNDFFDKLYTQFNIRRVLSARSINSVGSKRGAIAELMISNCV